MDFEEKVKILKSLDTRSLIAQLTEYEDELVGALTNQAEFIYHNYHYISSRGNDCAYVQEKVAGLLFQAPETNEAGKKTTLAQKDAWLVGQRKANIELAAAIANQQEVAFLQDNHQILVDMAKKRLEGTKAVLALKTAQINFLSGD